MGDLGQTLVDFLDHYARFDFATTAVSLSDGYIPRDPGSYTSPLVVVSPFNSTINLASAAFAMPNVARMFNDAHTALLDPSFSFVSTPPALAERDCRLRYILEGVPELPNRRASGMDSAPPDSPRRPPAWHPAAWEIADDFI